MARQTKAAGQDGPPDKRIRASDAAVETTLVSITEKLKMSPPLMYHINALLNNEEWTVVLTYSIPRGQGAQDDCGDKPGSGKKAWRLRAGMKKLAHLDRQDNNNINHN